ncbi:phosphotransferase [Leucobacter denitrificans]|uniref:Phosphotransferase n=1 Tax=Leucobacter denitrificans TaxID=683042 RepID=A0A7G9S4W4_9MICO|nr:phosphotransferase [Leucobacter denitrificans]QNN62889.1 phosphotransferase [Leucobacter denitrificans]
MASLPLTLAALATSAVPGLTAVAVRPHQLASEDYSAAILTTEDSEVIMSVPRTQQAETTQSASVLGISALSDGARSELPFEVPRVLGITRAGETRAVAMTFIPGFHFDVSDLESDALLIDSLAESIAAIHALPRSLAQQGGLPNRSAQDQRLAVTRIVDRAAATRNLPETVLHRWTEVLEAAEVWDFAPNMVHGTLSGDTVLVEEDRVVGILDWSGLSIGDPASDLAWLHEASPDVFEAVASRYFSRCNTGDSRSFRSRTRFYHELEIARWLLHGVDTHDQQIVDDAVGMLDQLVDRLSLLDAPLEARQQLSEAEAIDLLDQTPEVTDRLSETASYEALDEDRMFGVDTDFIEPLKQPEQTAKSSDSSDSSDPSEPSEDDQADENDDQLTQPIDESDLPRPPHS